MIHKLEVANFRSLGSDVQLDLGRLTVLVGRNGAGKSNVVDVFQFLADCMVLGLESALTKRHGIDAVRRWSSGHPYNVRIRVELGGSDATGAYEIELTGDRAMDYRVKVEALSILLDGTIHGYRIENGQWADGPKDLRPRIDPLGLALPVLAADERFRHVADELRGMAAYSIYPDALRHPQKYDPSKPMDCHGTNWVSILKDQRETTWKPDLVSVLGKLTGDIVDVDVNALGGFLTVQFVHGGEPTGRRSRIFDASQESDGTLRVAGMLTALLQEPRPRLVALEEPELTVHPGVLPLIQEYVDEAAQHLQIVLTTHSPDLLELFDVESVRVVERHEGATTVQPLARSQKEVVQQGLFSLGEVLRSEGLQQMGLFDEPGEG